MHAKIFALLVFIVSTAGLFTSVSLAAKPLTSENNDKPPIDLVVVIKSKRLMYLYVDGLPVKSFHIGLGDQPIGDKRMRGDERTPVGAYTLDWRNPNSIYYKSIHISYPDAQDIARAKAQGVDPGGLIMIHGQPDYDFRKRTGDWTNGCIAVSNHAMDVLWRRVPMGTPIHIYP